MIGQFPCDGFSVAVEYAQTVFFDAITVGGFCLIGIECQLIGFDRETPPFVVNNLASEVFRALFVVPVLEKRQRYGDTRTISCRKSAGIGAVNVVFDSSVYGSDFFARGCGALTAIAAGGQCKSVDKRIMLRIIIDRSF